MHGAGAEMKISTVAVILVFSLMAYTIAMQYQAIEEKKHELYEQRQAMNDSLKMTSFVYDFNEYSSICRTIQNSKTDIFKNRCKESGWDFVNYYLGFPDEDILLLCQGKDGAHILRFR